MRNQEADCLKLCDEIKQELKEGNWDQVLLPIAQLSKGLGELGKDDPDTQKAYEKTMEYLLGHIANRDLYRAEAALTVGLYCPRTTGSRSAYS